MEEEFFISLRSDGENLRGNLNKQNKTASHFDLLFFVLDSKEILKRKRHLENIEEENNRGNRLSKKISLNTIAKREEIIYYVR